MAQAMPELADRALPRRIDRSVIDRSNADATARWGGDDRHNLSREVDRDTRVQTRGRNLRRV